MLMFIGPQAQLPLFLMATSNMEKLLLLQFHFYVIVRY